jgi:hypothetical protein
MRKSALLIAAALVVSVPLSTIVTTDGYAAKAKRHHHRVARVAAAPAPTGPQPPFHDIWRALDDLGGQLAAAGRR